jgi:hypothetical protein
VASRSDVILAGRAPRPREHPAAVRASAYIVGRFWDNFWIILCPVFALLLMQALWKWSGLSDLAIFSILFGLIVTGHHMPGWIRAFGEPEVYARHKGRLWVSVFAIPALVILPTAAGPRKRGDRARSRPLPAKRDGALRAGRFGAPIR